MSNTIIPDRRPASEGDGDTSVEQWLRVSLLALVPLIVAFYVSDEWQPYLFVAGGLLLVVGAVLLVRQELSKRGERRD